MITYECRIPERSPRLQGDAPLTAEAAMQEARRCLGLLPCQSCDLCRLLCPDLCITRDEGGGLAIDYQYCKGCGICAAVCPKGAIKMMPDKQG